MLSSFETSKLFMVMCTASSKTKGKYLVILEVLIECYIPMLLTIM